MRHGINIDWQELALNLRRHKSLVEISRKLGKHKNWLAQVAREGSEPKFNDGLLLLNLHLDLCGIDKHKRLIK